MHPVFRQKVRKRQANLLDTGDDRNPALPYKDPKLWELWYIPYSG